MTKKLIKKFLPKAIGMALNTQLKFNKKKALDKAYHLFSTPRYGQVKAHQFDFLEKAKSNLITVDSYSIQSYHWPGNGPTVLLIHGWDSNSFRWKSLVKKLKQKDYNIIGFDAPAHGNSSGKILNVLIYADVLEEMISKFSPAYLVGHSIGAMTIVFNQHKFGNKSFIKKIALLGAPSEMAQIMNDYKKILSLSEGFMTELDSYFKNKFNYYFKEFSIARFAKSIEIPVLVIHDKYDKIAPIQAAFDIHDNLKQGTIITTEGAGHSLKKHGVDKNIITFISE